MRLYLIRHAESSNNVAYGSNDYHLVHEPDPEITDTGHQQAELLAEFLAASGNESRRHPEDTSNTQDFDFSHVYCSLMTRSLATAAYIGRAIGIYPEARHDLFEYKGIYEVDESGQETGVEGPARDYFSDRFPEVRLPQSLDGTGWWNRPVESEDEFFVRVKQSLDDIVRIHGESSDNVGLVVHGDYIDQCVNELMGVARKPENYGQAWVSNWVVHNTSVSRIDIVNGSRNIVYLNRIDHLPGKMVTW